MSLEHSPARAGQHPQSLADGDEVLPAPVVSAITDLSERTLERKRQTGVDSIPYIQLSRRRIGYLKSDVLSWLSARRVQSTSEADALRGAESTGEADGPRRIAATSEVRAARRARR